MMWSRYEMKSLSKIHHRLTDVPADTWMSIVILNPSECSRGYCKGEYLLYQAYWYADPQARPFLFSVRASRFRDAIRAVPQSLREDTTHPIKFTFKRDRRSNIQIRDWEVLA
jgi:hypothetical protein